MEIVLSDENVIAIKGMVDRAIRAMLEVTLECLSTPKKHKEKVEAVEAVLEEINGDIEQTLHLLGRKSE